MERGCRDFRADIGIKNGRIAKIGRLRASDAAKTVDASGHIVAPGFVDLHTHYDAQLFWDPYCSISSWHGVTSVVIGNCGFGFAPVHPDGARARDAHDDARRGDPLRLDEGRNAVGLDDLSGIPRQHRSPSQGGEHPAVCFGLAAAHLRHGHRGSQDASADRARGARDLPPARRGDGCGRVRMVRAAARSQRPRLRAARLRRHADGFRSDERRHLLSRSRACSVAATRASCR